MKLSSPSRGVLWLAGYLLFLAAIVLGVFQARDRVLKVFGTPQVAAEWDEWREAVRQQADRGPVRRRPPKSPEPPALVLMRDHFAVVMAAAVVFGSLLFATFAIAVRGVFARGKPDLTPEREGTLPYDLSRGERPSRPQL